MMKGVNQIHEDNIKRSQYFKINCILKLEESNKPSKQAMEVAVNEYG